MNLPTCHECTHLVPFKRCSNWMAAGLRSLHLGELADTPQRCPGYRPRAQPPPAPAPPPQPKTEHRPIQTTTQTENQPVQEQTDTQDSKMIVSETTSTAFTPCPAGTYLARCCRLIDLGTQETEFQGEHKSARKVSLSFEILDAETRRDDGSPFVITKRFTLSLHEKSSLRKDLASWRGRDFTPEELRGFHMRNILDKDCLISVIQTTKGERTFANIASIMKPPKGTKAPEGTANEPVLYWSMSEEQPDWSAFAALHPKLVEQIQASPEFKRLTPPKSIPANTTSPAPAPAAQPGAVGSGFDDMDDDLDF